jgi:DNA-binding transcriptional MerR regulator
MEIQNFPQPVLPDKLYFKVGEVSKLVDLPAHVLRFWETEFKKINPKRTPSGQRLYRKADVEIIFKIKYLLYEKKFTIEGARQFLKTTSNAPGGDKINLFLKDLRNELENIKKILA